MATPFRLVERSGLSFFRPLHERMIQLASVRQDKSRYRSVKDCPTTAHPTGTDRRTPVLRKDRGRSSAALARSVEVMAYVLVPAMAPRTAEASTSRRCPRGRSYNNTRARKAPARAVDMVRAEHAAGISGTT